jgi:ABC-type molybdate transport system substrate-binding protein
VRLNRTFACMLSLSVISSSAVAAELKVLSVGTVGNVLREVIPVYEQDSGNRVQISFANPAVVLDRVRRGEPADIVIQAQVLWEQIEMLGIHNENIAPYHNFRSWIESRNKTNRKYVSSGISADHAKGRIGRPRRS